MTRSGVAIIALGLVGFAATAFAAERATLRPHFDMAVAAAGVGVVAVVVGGGVERLATRFGDNAIVLGYYLGVGTRGGLALVGACGFAAKVFEPTDRGAWLLWVMAAYLAVLAFETVRAVRAADRAKLAVSERVEGPNE